jgi:ubiquinone/menaquinone biosynthesis C-methylase UbiE
MSTYERYDKVAAHYDGSRVPIGAEIIAESLAAHVQPLAKPLAEVELLDAGCGTGAYSAALAGRVGRITAVDLSEGMLAIARAKLALAERDGRAVLRHGSITALPFAEASFDAVMFNQVLHHLEDGGDPAYGGHARALAEAQRVLRPGGLAVVNVCTHEQLTQGFWYYDLIPAALGAVLKRCVTAERLEAILAEAGFVLRERIVPRTEAMQGAAYLRADGPLDPDWRRGDSIWALASPAELAAAEARVRALAEVGGLEAYVAAQDAGRTAVGQFSFFVAAKA